MAYRDNKHKSHRWWKNNFLIVKEEQMNINIMIDFFLKSNY